MVRKKQPELNFHAGVGDSHLRIKKVIAAALCTAQADAAV